MFYESPRNFPEEALASRLTTLDPGTPFLSYLQDCVALSELNQLFPFFFLAEFLWFIKTSTYRFSCIDKGKDSTSDLDQEIDFQKKMMDVSSGSNGMQ